MADDKNTLLAQQANLYADNNTGDISPSDTRTVSAAITTSNLNLAELSTQEVEGQINHQLAPTVLGIKLIPEAPITGGNYVRGVGEWIQRLTLIAVSNSTIPINNSSVNPSFFIIDDITGSIGVELVNGADGSIRNITGRTIKQLTGTISFNPSVSGGSLRRMVIVSEVSTDNGVSWQGNLNTIRKVEIGASTETFKTTVSLASNWVDDSILRFRAYDEASNGLSLVTESQTILSQAFTGPSLVWSLVEN